MNFYSYSDFRSDISIIENDGHRIVTFILSDDRNFVEVVENCDDHFCTKLNYDDVMELIDHLRRLSSEMFINKKGL